VIRQQKTEVCLDYDGKFVAEIDSRRISARGWGGDGEKKLSPCSCIGTLVLRRLLGESAGKWGLVRFSDCDGVGEAVLLAVCWRQIHETV